MLSSEQKEKARYVFKEVKLLEKEYKSEDSRTITDIEKCYTDEYILHIWKSEKNDEEEGEGWLTFEGFLIDFIEGNLIHR